MDNLTHSLTGVLMSRAGLNRLCPRATAILFLSANAPDCDAISAAGGTDLYFHYHRWITHSLIMIPVIALAVAVFVKLVFRKTRVPLLPAWGLAILGVMSHLLLDFTNQYGIRLFLPFSDAWPGLSITNVVDVWVWLLLLIAAIWPLLSGLVSSEIGAKKSRGQGLAIAGLVLFFLYDCGRAVMHARAVAVQEARIYDGESPIRVGAYPTALNPQVWRGVVETESAYFVFEEVRASDFDPSVGKKYLKPENTQAIQAAKRSVPMQRLLQFSPFVILRQTPASDLDNGIKVEGTDLRFSSPAGKGFTSTVLLDASLREQRAWFHY